jgi:hypothetical protein
VAAGKKPRFEKGNKLATGGKRPGSGRKPDVVREALDDLLNKKQTIKGARGKTLVQLAAHTIVEALVQRDEDGQVSMVAVRAAETVIDRAFGKPRMTVEVQGRGSNLLEVLAADDQAIANNLLRDVLPAEATPSPTPTPPKPAKPGVKK